MKPYQIYLLGALTFLIAAFCILYPQTLIVPTAAEVKVKVVRYTEWVEVPGETVFLPGETVYVYDDSLGTDIKVSRDSLHIEMDKMKGYVLTYYDHFRDRFTHDFEFEVLKETEIIEIEKTVYVKTPVRLFPKYITARYLTGINSKTISLSFGGRFYEKIMIGLAGEIQIHEKDVIGQVGIESGYEF